MINIEQILQEVSRGSESAFREFYNLYKDNIYHTALELQLKSGDNFKLPFFDFDLSIFPFD